VNAPTPAIVSQDGVRRLPRWGLLLFCAIYVLAGFLWRDPWKRVDLTSFGYMLELARGQTSWWAPGLLGESAHFDALLPYWLGAWAIQLTPSGGSPFFSVRVVFAGLLVLTLLAVWYGIYYLARSPQAQPVSFAFGGEARPTDYARAIADGGLLAFLACLGLAQPSHEVSPALAQLCFSALTLYAMAALAYRYWMPALLGTLGLVGLTLSGAPSLAILFGLLGILVLATGQRDWSALHESDGYETDPDASAALQRRRRRWLLGLVLLTVVCALLATGLDLWRWRIERMPARWIEWRNLIRMHLWFTWPVWPMILWTLWRWRTHWRQGRPDRHIALPLGLGLICSAGGWVGERPETTLLLGFPAFAALAAFALPTFRRSASAFVDWFTLIFFTLAAGYLWFMWIAMHVGAPTTALRQIDKQLHGYLPPFDWPQFLLGLFATLGWIFLVRWRTKRLRPAIWKSMILPAGGVTLSWVLLTSLWMPAINHARSYAFVGTEIATLLSSKPTHTGCTAIYGLDDAQISALRYYSTATLTRDRDAAAQCDWLVADVASVPILPHVYDMTQWSLQDVVGRPTDPRESLHVFARVQR
jgi:hypothetical protein